MSEPEELSPPYLPENEYGDAQDPSDPGLQPPNRPDPAPIAPKPDPGRPVEPPPDKDPADPGSPERGKGHARIINGNDEIPIENIPGNVGQHSIDTVSKVLDEAINDPQIKKMIEKKFYEDAENGAPGDIRTNETKKIIAAQLLEDVVRRTAKYEAEDPENPLLKLYQDKRTGPLLDVKNSDAPTIVLSLEYIQAMQKIAYNENARQSDKRRLRSRRSNLTSVDQSPDGALGDAGGLIYLLEKSVKTYIDPETGEDKSLELSKVKEDYTFDRMILQVIKRRIVPVETLFEWEVLSLQAKKAEKDGDKQKANELRQQLTNEQYQYDERIRDALGKPDVSTVRLENKAIHKKVQAILREFAREGFVATAQNKEEMLTNLTGNSPEEIAERQRLLDLLGPKINATSELILQAANDIKAQDDNRIERSKKRFDSLSDAVDKDPLKYRQRAFKILWNIQHRQLRQTDLYNQVTHLRNKRYTQDPNEQGPEGDINKSGIIKEPTPPDPPPPPPPETPLSELPTAPIEGDSPLENLPVAPTEGDGPPEELPTAPVEKVNLKRDFAIGAAALKDRIPQEVGNLADHVIAHDANKEPRRQTRWGIFWGVGEAIRHPVRLWQNSMLRPVFRRQAEDFVLRAENTVKGTDSPIPIELTPELLDTMLIKGMEPPYRQGRLRRFFAAPFRNVLGIGLKTDQSGGLRWLRGEMAKDPPQRDATLRASRDRMLTEQNKLGERYAEVGEGLTLEVSNRLALKQGDLEETRHLLEPTEEQKTALNNKVKELLTRYHTDNTFTDEELVKAFNNYLQNDFIQYVPDQYKAEFTAPEYASNILNIAHTVDGRNPDGTRIEGSTIWEDYHRTGDNNTPSAWDELKFNVYYGKGEWGAVRGKNEETLNTRWLTRRLESRDYRQNIGTAKGIEYATAVVTYGGSYALAYGSALATIGRGTLSRIIPFVGPASVAAIRESGLGWSYRGKWRGFKGNVAREIEQASREAARGRDLQAGSPLRAEYEREALVGRKSAQDYITTINQALENQQPTDNQMNALLIELADLKARLDLSDASSTKALNYKVQNFITYNQGEENEQNAQLRQALQSGVLKLQRYATSNAGFLNSRATEIISQNGRDGLLDRYALVMNAQLRMSSDGQQMSRWFRQTGLTDAEITQLLTLHAALPQDRRDISRDQSLARKERNQRRLSTRKAVKMFAVTGALSLGTAGLLSEAGSLASSPGKDLARWRDIASGNTPSSEAGATSSIQRAVIFAVNNADRIPYADNAGQAALEVARKAPGATGQVLSDVHTVAQAGQDTLGDFINSVPVAGNIVGGAYGSSKQLAEHFINIGRERGSELTQEVRPTLDIAQEKTGVFVDKVPYTDQVAPALSDVSAAAASGVETVTDTISTNAPSTEPLASASETLENASSLSLETAQNTTGEVTLPPGVEITTEDGKKFISFEKTKIDITGLTLEQVPPSEANDFTGQLVIKDSTGNIITNDPAAFFHEKGLPLEMDYKQGPTLHEQLLDSSLPPHKEQGSQFPDTLIPGGTHWQGDDLVLDSDPTHVLIRDVRIDSNTGEILFQTDHDPAVDYSGAAGTEVIVKKTDEITLNPNNLKDNLPPDTQIVANPDGSFDLVAKSDPSTELIEGVRIDPTTGKVTYEQTHSGVHFTTENGPTTTILQSGLEGKLTQTNLEANLPPGIKAEQLSNGNIRLYPEADQSITLLEGKFDGNTFITLETSNEMKVIETLTPDTILTGDVAKAELLTYGTQVEWGTGYWNDTSIAEKAELQMHTFHTQNAQGNHVLTVSLLTNPYDTAQQTGVGQIYLPDVIKEDKIALTIWLPDHTGTPILLRDSMDGKIDGSFIFDPDSTTQITLGDRTTTIGELTKMVIDNDALASTPMGNNATEYNQFFNVGKLGVDGKYGYFSTAYIARDGDNPLLREITTIKYNGGMNITTPGTAEYAFKTIGDITKETSVHKLQIDEITNRVPGFIAIQDITEDHPTRIPHLLISDIPDDSGFDLNLPYSPVFPGRRNIEKSKLNDRQATGEITTAITPNTPQPPTQVAQDDNDNEDNPETTEGTGPVAAPPITTPIEGTTPFPEINTTPGNTDDTTSGITPFPPEDNGVNPGITPFPGTNTTAPGITPFVDVDTSINTTPFPDTSAISPDDVPAGITPFPDDRRDSSTTITQINGNNDSGITPFSNANITPADNSGITPFDEADIQSGTTPFSQDDTNTSQPAANRNYDSEITSFGEAVEGQHLEDSSAQTTPFDDANAIQTAPIEENPQAEITPGDGAANITPFNTVNDSTAQTTPPNRDNEEPEITPFDTVDSATQVSPPPQQTTPIEGTTPFPEINTTPGNTDDTTTRTEPASVTPFVDVDTSINTTPFPPEDNGANPGITPFDDVNDSGEATPFPEQDSSLNTTLKKPATVKQIIPPASKPDAVLEEMISRQRPVPTSPIKMPSMPHNSTTRTTPFSEVNITPAQLHRMARIAQNIRKKKLMKMPLQTKQSVNTSFTGQAAVHANAVKKQTQRSDHEGLGSDNPIVRPTASIKPLIPPRPQSDVALDEILRRPPHVRPGSTRPITPATPNVGQIIRPSITRTTDVYPFGATLADPKASFNKITPPPMHPSVSQPWSQGTPARDASSLEPDLSETTNLATTYANDIYDMTTTYVKDKSGIMSTLRNDIKSVGEERVSEKDFERKWGMSPSAIKKLDEHEIDGLLRDYFARTYSTSTQTKDRKLNNTIAIRAIWETLNNETKKKINIQELERIVAEKGLKDKEAIDNYLASVNVSPDDFWGTNDDRITLFEAYRDNITRDLLDAGLSKRGI